MPSFHCERRARVKPCSTSLTQMGSFVRFCTIGSIVLRSGFSPIPPENGFSSWMHIARSISVKVMTNRIRKCSRILLSFMALAGQSALELRRLSRYFGRKYCLFTSLKLGISILYGCPGSLWKPPIGLPTALLVTLPIMCEKKGWLIHISGRGSPIRRGGLAFALILQREDPPA